MARDTTTERGILQDLGDGLVLRRATREDADALAAFNAEIHRWPESTESNPSMGAWTRDLLRGDHPTVDPGDFTVVEDRHSDTIVSTLGLISQTWTYDGIPFGVGQPELVGTHPDYRRRGLVRAQLAWVHRWSAERGQPVQGITGIPWYYRQFGYEHGGLSLGGARTGYLPHVPELKDGEPEPYRLRPATEADLPLLMELAARQATRSLVACVRDEALWRYELTGRSEESEQWRPWRIVETAAGEPVGMLAHGGKLWGKAIGARAYELRPGISWLAVTPSVVRYLVATGREYAARDGRECAAFAFMLGTEHPVYAAFGDRLPRTVSAYAWYLRVPDLPRFLRQIAPALERRLAESPLAGHDGELKISFYRDGLRLAFDRGSLTDVEPWQPAHGDEGAAAFPGLTFLQLLFGYRALHELRYAFADCWVEGDEPRELLTALFPKRASDVLHVA
jgi:RimJ/RimL family protein N-acetyltransferase